MSKRSSKKKNIVGSSTEKAIPARLKARSSGTATTREFTFGRDTYIWMGIGFGLVLVGMLLMMGGHMTDPNVWDENVIYSFQRTVLAPLVIVTGLVVEIYAIFKK